MEHGGEFVKANYGNVGSIRCCRPAYHKITTYIEITNGKKEGERHQFPELEFGR